MTAQNSHPKRIYRKDYAPPPYVVERAELFFASIPRARCGEAGSR